MRAMTAGSWIESAPLAGGAGALLVEPTLASRGRRLQPVSGEPAPEPRDDFVAESEPMRRLVAEVEQVAPRDVTVLVRGPAPSCA
jgi:DNA-binding NtrC family response regulator